MIKPLQVLQAFISIFDGVLFQNDYFYSYNIYKCSSSKDEESNTRRVDLIPFSTLSNFYVAVFIFQIQYDVCMCVYV